ncbi:FAD-dependent monooxygenase [Streptomyces albus]|uniref:FAD-dependent monooxygenase n=1 Tax=Streptomyces albus TaxID=1888 RepID=UPI0033E61972
MSSHTRSRTVLISGASIAGPALAYWLDRHGFDVTLVEKAPRLRGGGYPVDIRGTAMDVVDHMGLVPRLRKAHVDTRRLSFVDDAGATIAAVAPAELTAGVTEDDLEIPRGELADGLYELIRDRVEILFSDSIASLTEHPGHVDVLLRSGARRSVDLVVGADGLHSHTRGLVLGPEEQYHHYLGYCFAGFTLPARADLSREAVVWNAPGRAAVLYATAPGAPVHGFLAFSRDEPPFAAFRDPAAQRDLVADTFAGDPWEVRGLLAAMREADDLFFDVVSQIRLPAWHRGRVALVGDAAHAPSFLSGQGSSLALVGAYVLAGELATRPDHTAAFTAYEAALRGFVRSNQDYATTGGAALLPRTAEELARRNEALTNPVPARPAGADRALTTTVELPDYPGAR